MHKVKKGGFREGKRMGLVRKPPPSKSRGSVRRLEKSLCVALIEKRIPFRDRIAAVN